jgi:hypothetical protein
MLSSIASGQLQVSKNINSSNKTQGQNKKQRKTE